MSGNLYFQTFRPAEERWALLGQRPVIAWLTGLSGSGKSSIASVVDRELSVNRRHSVILDGDNLRHGLNKDLGFNATDRSENIRRTAEVARMFAEVGMIVIVSLISPFRNDRLSSRELAGSIPFLEVFVDTPLEICENRDPKGLYRRARRGEINAFTGISSTYEHPVSPDLRITTCGTVEESAQSLADILLKLSSYETQ